MHTLFPSVAFDRLEQGERERERRIPFDRRFEDLLLLATKGGSYRTYGGGKS